MKGFYEIIEVNPDLVNMQISTCSAVCTGEFEFEKRGKYMVAVYDEIRFSNVPRRTFETLEETIEFLYPLVQTGAIFALWIRDEVGKWEQIANCSKQCMNIESKNFFADIFCQWNTDDFKALINLAERCK